MNHTHLGVVALQTILLQDLYSQQQHHVLCIYFLFMLVTDGTEFNELRECGDLACDYVGRCFIFLDSHMESISYCSVVLILRHGLLEDGDAKDWREH